MPIASINPATGETLQDFSPLTPLEIEARLEIAQETFRTYRHSDLAQRKQNLETAAQILETNAAEYGRLITLEMGKPLKSAIAEVKKCALVCRYYAEEGEKFLQPTPIPTEASQSYIQYDPLGVILAVMPWNFPFWQVFRFAAPALMAGNVGLLKHASNVPQCALAIAEILHKAGFPEGAFQTLLITADQVEQVITSPLVQAATLTGSEPAGASLAAIAGNHLKKTVLELGGSDPFIVMPSANLAEAAQVGTTARMLNNGQSCIAAKRFILHRHIAEPFLELLKTQFSQLTLGDPLDENTDIGPLATPGILKDLVQQVDMTVAAGAIALCGGAPLNRPGNYYPPTILTQIPPHSPGMMEEFFGPVALVFVVDSLEEAIALANGTEFGLGASGWTTDPQEQQQLINHLEAGAVFINAMVKSDPRLPFGGIKRSGYGRELGLVGFQEFLNLKTVWVP